MMITVVVRTLTGLSATEMSNYSGMVVGAGEGKGSISPPCLH
jgi:hypothetical protein